MGSIGIAVAGPVGGHHLKGHPIPTSRLALAARRPPGGSRRHAGSSEAPQFRFDPGSRSGGFVDALWPAARGSGSDRYTTQVGSSPLSGWPSDATTEALPCQSACQIRADLGSACGKGRAAAASQSRVLFRSTKGLAPEMCLGCVMGGLKGTGASLQQASEGMAWGSAAGVRHWAAAERSAGAWRWSWRLALSAARRGWIGRTHPPRGDARFLANRGRANNCDKISG
jgi:hypothetical protein